MASGTPPVNWSAKRMLARFRMLTVPLASLIWELTIEVGEANLGMALVTPAGVPTTGPADWPAVAAAIPTTVVCVAGFEGLSATWGTLVLPGAAFKKAEAGSPPRVWASAASKTYGTLANSVLGCSDSPGSCACTPSQRCSPDENNSGGTPSSFVTPSKAA